MITYLNREKQFYSKKGYHFHSCMKQCFKNWFKGQSYKGYFSPMSSRYLVFLQM